MFTRLGCFKHSAARDITERAWNPRRGSFTKFLVQLFSGLVIQQIQYIFDYTSIPIRLAGECYLSGTVRERPQRKRLREASSLQFEIHSSTDLSNDPMPS